MSAQERLGGFNFGKGAQATATPSCELPVPESTDSSFRVVTLDKISRRWRAEITLGCNKKSLGSFEDEEDAAHAYDAEVRKLQNASHAQVFNCPTEDETSAEGKDKNGKAMSSRFTGVAKHRGGWQAQITHGGRNKCLGTFKHDEDAARAFYSAVINLHLDRKRNFGHISNDDEEEEERQEKDEPEPAPAPKPEDEREEEEASLRARSALAISQMV